MGGRVPGRGPVAAFVDLSTVEPEQAVEERAHRKDSEGNHSDSAERDVPTVFQRPSAKTNRSNPVRLEPSWL